MAITTNASYVPTLAEFEGHWEDVNAARGAAGALVLSSGDTLATATAAKDELMALETQLQQRLNDQQLARGGIHDRKNKLLYWFGRFAEVFDAYFAATPWREARPLAPQFNLSVEDFVRPMLDVEDLWERFNGLSGAEKPPGLTVPIVLLGQASGETLALAGFSALIQELRAYADEETKAAGRVKRSRSRRNFVQQKAYALMKLYRQAMPPALPSGDALQGTLPRLTPADTGSTPEPVAASAVYVSGSQSRTVYEASAAADLKEYQLRGVVGEEWDEEDAVTIATNGPDAAREFVVNFGLTQPGTSVVLKVYVVTLTGRERGSAPMRVERG
jgi:hypothetical protein